VSAQDIGRGPTGRLRAFAHMTDEKLLVVYGQLMVEATDDEAIARVVEEIEERGLHSSPSYLARRSHGDHNR